MDSLKKWSSDLRITKLNGSDNYISWRRNSRIIQEWYVLDGYLDANQQMGVPAAQANQAAAADYLYLTLICFMLIL